jgi:hypothetical protein
MTSLIPTFDIIILWAGAADGNDLQMQFPLRVEGQEHSMQLPLQHFLTVHH